MQNCHEEVSLKGPSIPKFLLYPQLRPCFQVSQTRASSLDPIVALLTWDCHHLFLCLSTNCGIPWWVLFISVSTELSAQPFKSHNTGHEMVTETKPHVASIKETMITWQLCSSCGTHFHLQPTCHLPFWQEVYKPSLHCHVPNRMTRSMGAEGKQLRTPRWWRDAGGWCTAWTAKDQHSRNSEATFSMLRVGSTQLLVEKPLNFLKAADEAVTQASDLSPR